MLKEVVNMVARALNCNLTIIWSVLRPYIWFLSGNNNHKILIYRNMHLTKFKYNTLD